jgi:hypothetical protein
MKYTKYVKRFQAHGGNMNLSMIHDVIAHPNDNSFVIMTHGREEAHLVSSWNSYIQWENEDTLLIPVGGMRQAEENLKFNSQVKCILANKEVMGANYKGVGFSIYGEAELIDQGDAYQKVKNRFPWARAAMRIRITSIKQVHGS